MMIFIGKKEENCDKPEKQILIYYGNRQNSTIIKREAQNEI